MSLQTATAKLIYEADDGVGGRKLMERKSLRAALMREWKAQKVPVVDRTAAMSQIVDAAPYSVAVHTAFRTELTKLTTLAAEESSSLQKSRLRDSIGRLEHAVRPFFCFVEMCCVPPGFSFVLQVTHNAGGRSGTWTKLRDSVASPAAKASLFDVVRSMMPQNRSRTPTDKSYRDVDVVDATTFGIANVPSNYSLSPSQAAASTARLAFLKRELSELSKVRY